jgi:hypothetical protein
MEVRFMLSFFGFLGDRPSTARATGSSRFRPMVECLEERTLLSSAPVAPVAVPALQAALVQTIAQQTNLTIPLQIPVQVTDLAFVNGQLLATLNIAGQVVENVPLNLNIDLTQDAACPILSLEIPQGIHLDLLGLNVDTSGICLNITAEPGPGNLLGNLLCGITGILDQGGLLGGLLGQLTGPVSLNNLLGLINTVGTGLGLTPGQIGGIIDGVLDSLLDVIGPALTTGLGNVLGTPTLADVAVTGTTPGACDILNLDLGPIDLNLLGLRVVLDDCEGGPVEVDITAERGPGNLLGNLLCGLASLLDSNASDVALGNKLNKIGRTIGGLV